MQCLNMPRFDIFMLFEQSSDLNFFEPFFSMFLAEKEKKTVICPLFFSRLNFFLEKKTQEKKNMMGEVRPGR